MKLYDHICVKCRKIFQTHKKQQKYCTHTCYAKRFDYIAKICEACNESFTVPYRFRAQRSCNKECSKILIRNKLKTCVIKQCLACNKEFDVVQSYKLSAKYCSYLCFLSTRKSRQKSIVKICENCKNEFTTSFVRQNKRFCNKRCAKTGKFNFQYRKPSPRLGKSSWSRGLTKLTDQRLALMGNKISQSLKRRFKLGLSSNSGTNNPNYGNTSETFTPEKRYKFSIAAINRIKSGVIGYKTGHITGVYNCKKSTSVRFKSSWELLAMMWWDNNSDIRSYEYEPISVTLLDGKRSIPDFKVLYVDDTCKFFEIKPTLIQQIENIKLKLDLTRRAINELGYEYVLIGDNEIKNMKSDLGEEFETTLMQYKNRI